MRTIVLDCTRVVMVAGSAGGAPAGVIDVAGNPLGRAGVRWVGEDQHTLTRTDGRWIL